MKVHASLAALALLPASISFAQATELTLPQAKWVGTFDKYVCSETSTAKSRPQALEALDVKFEQVVTDATLDNALLKASFVENGKTCRYNAVLLADNSARTSKLVQSIAFDPTGGATAYRDCAAGKAILDRALQDNDYLYYGHPHNLALLIPIAGSDEACGTGSEVVGVNFVVKGRLPQPTP